MLELDQQVIVITEKGTAYEGYIMERASNETGTGAYRIGLDGAGFEQQGQWHKACDIFVVETTKENSL